MSENDAKALIKKTVKSHLPKDWLTEMRIMYRLAMETINGIKRTDFVTNLATITTMWAILTIFGVLLRTTLSLANVTNALGSVLEISAYLSASADYRTVASDIKRLDHVRAIKYIPKENAWKELKAVLDVADIENPLPDTLRIEVDKADNIASVYDAVKKQPGISDLNYAKAVAEKLQLFTHAVSAVTIVGVFAIAMLTIIVMNNTIQFVIQLKKDEIEIMRLMGVSDWYIKTPLILQGAIYGFIGATLALIPLNAVEGALLKAHSFFNVASPPLATNTVMFVLFVVAIGCGALGSFMCIRKHLQV